MAAIPHEYPAGSIHSSSGWEGQLARISRWLDRLLKSRSPDDAEDFLYAFFQNCYHFRDWLVDTKEQDKLKGFLGDNLPMRICRDVANLTKHLSLTRPAAQGHQLSILREFAGDGNGWFENDSRLAIVSNYNDKALVIDARDVAIECLRLWCDFLPNCDLVQEIRQHFKFSVSKFDQVLAKAEAMSDWAQEAMKHRTK